MPPSGGFFVRAIFLLCVASTPGEMTPPDLLFPLPGDEHSNAQLRVDRALTELRQGRLLLVSSDNSPGRVLLAVAIEALTPGGWRHYQTSRLPWRVVFTAERLHALGWAQASTARSMLLSPQAALADIQALAAVRATAAKVELLSDPQTATSAAESMLWLAKHARLTPALLVVEVAVDDIQLQQSPWLKVHASDVHVLAQGPESLSRPELFRVSDADLPLALAGSCTAVLFREAHGTAEHVAIVVGRPDFNQAVQVRLHSSCLTGDIFGSLRCDCGEQLQRALAQLAVQGGVLLYLSQEGRGTGLANKLRAYRLQDTGLDTIDADRHLGFKGDERDFQVAVSMLRALGISEVKLLTNNPKKIEALRAGGIKVVERIALIPPTNPHNERYIRTKTERAGHLKVDDEQDEA
jgi:GTP cyclohydrolase II